jgi:hypothetical protein
MDRRGFLKCLGLGFLSPLSITTLNIDTKKEDPPVETSSLSPYTAPPPSTRFGKLEIYSGSLPSINEPTGTLLWEGSILLERTTRGIIGSLTTGVVKETGYMDYFIFKTSYLPPFVGTVGLYGHDLNVNNTYVVSGEDFTIDHLLISLA